MGCFEPAKVVVGVEEGSLTEEELQALADDCENGNEEACEQLDALEDEGGASESSNPDDEESESDPSDWESWEDVDTSDPDDLVEWFEETIEECEDGWRLVRNSRKKKLLKDYLKSVEERNGDACETLEELEEIFEDFEDDFESDSDGPGGGGPGELLEHAEELDEARSWQSTSL